MSDPTCPSCHCGEPLTPAPDDAVEGTAPWQCAPCSRGFFDAELTSTAQEAWRPAYRDYGRDVTAIAIHDQIEAEVAEMTAPPEEPPGVVVGG